MDSTGQNNGRGGSGGGRGRVSRRRGPPAPMKFMFIDSSDKGTNAKPDKAVRSFVMHQARRNKPWSTRQRSEQSPSSAKYPHSPDRSPASSAGSTTLSYPSSTPPSSHDGV